MADRRIDFKSSFRKLTGNPPFPWQEALYKEWFAKGEFPQSCNLPTGLGKTSVVAIWLIAQKNYPDRVPRRLVYVVNRRTVVDQTTVEAESMLKNAAAAGVSVPAISTLRGQFADNREWSADPSQPAIIVGTVDMIGSRLLFSGYGIGFKSRPLHAGFLGQDALLIHDEAHLEPAFQKLLTQIELEQNERERTAKLPWPKLQVVELSATSRSGGETFALTAEDKKDAIVSKRLGAKKVVVLHEIEDEKKLADKLIELAKAHENEDRAVIVFVRRVDDVERIAAKLPQDRTQRLTGTMRGWERDRMVETSIFQRFLAPSNRDDKVPPAEGTVYLVCTSAGEVGVNLSADDVVCDLSTYESMAQRFGRVNRFGECKKTRIDIVHPTQFEQGKEPEVRRERTLALLQLLDGDGSPKALSALAKKESEAVQNAFSSPPLMLDTSDILFDAWALTSIYREPLPGRPPVAPYLHGLDEWEPPVTQVAWREEVAIITNDLAREHAPTELLADYPLKPHELLRDRSDRVFKHIEKLAERNPTSAAWLIEDEGSVEIVTLAELSNKNDKERLQGRTILLPPTVGGLRDGLLDGDIVEPADDVADKWFDDRNRPRRLRLWDEVTDDDELRLIRTIDCQPGSEENTAEDSVETSRRIWNWYERSKEADNDGSKNAAKSVLWEVHTEDVERNIQEIVERLPLSNELRHALILAARFHDLGKRRDLFQRLLGNRDAAVLLAKSGRKQNRFDHGEPYRHEFGSLSDTLIEAEFLDLDPEQQDLVLHLIAAHHGRGRPHFNAAETFDPQYRPDQTEAIAAEVPRRFARLQRRYGRWGLAYLESILRAADYRASAEPSEFVEKSAEVRA